MKHETVNVKDILITNQIQLTAAIKGSNPAKSSNSARIVYFGLLGFAGSADRIRAY